MAIDPRAYSEERIDPPDPLPLVSRGALKRVLNPLPIPTVCKCGGEVKLECNSKLYGRAYGKWPYMYICWDCKSYVGLHPHTDIPLGTLADAETRRARKNAKHLFFDLLERKNVNRNELYSWLSQEMGIDVNDCHFAWFDVEQCRLATDICFNEIQTLLRGHNEDSSC